MSAARTLHRRIAVVVLVAAAITAYRAAQAADAPPSRGAVAPRALEGTWQGQLLNIRIVLKLRPAPGGGLAGSLDSPDQGATGLPVDAVTLKGDSLRLDLHSIRASFAGAVSPARDAIAGQWSQNSMTLPLTLRRGPGAGEMRKPQEPVPPLPYAAKEVTYENPKGRVHLAGTLTIPEGLGPFPAALLLSGSGPEDRDEAVFGHRPFLVLADYLTRHGVAVLRVDDRGVGASTGSLAGTTMTDLVDDALCGVAYLRARPEIDPARIGLIGHSEGGMVGLAATVRSNGAVAYLVLLAAPGVTGDSLILMQTAAIRRSSGASEADIAGEQVLEAKIYDALKALGDSASVAPGVQALLAQLLATLPEDQAKAMGGRDRLAAQQLKVLLSPWFRFMIAYDPRPTLTQVRCPVLAMNGEKDQQVPARKNLGAIEAAFHTGGNPDATVRLMPRLNHLFQTCDLGTIAEYATLDETFAEAALDTLGGWIVKRTGAVASPAAKRPAAKKPAAKKSAAKKP